MAKEIKPNVIGKEIYKSKMFWVNGIVPIVAAIGMYFYGELDLPALFFGGSGILAIILRYQTKEPIKT